MRSTQLMAAVALACSAFASNAQCTKDIDCKGNRICGEAGRCVTPNASSLKPLTAPVAPAAPAPTALPRPNPKTDPAVPAVGDYSPENLGRSIEEALKCDKAPEPGVVFSILYATRFILADPVVVSDGMEVYSINKPLYVFGMKAVQITGFDPKLSKYRGPGTATPLNLSVVVYGEQSQVQAEVLRRGGKDVVIGPASYTKYMKAATEITCFGK